MKGKLSARCCSLGSQEGARCSRTRRSRRRPCSGEQRTSLEMPLMLVTTTVEHRHYYFGRRTSRSKIGQSRLRPERPSCNPSSGRQTYGMAARPTASDQTSTDSRCPIGRGPAEQDLAVVTGDHGSRTKENEDHRMLLPLLLDLHGFLFIPPFDRSGSAQSYPD